VSHFRLKCTKLYSRRLYVRPPVRSFVRFDTNWRRLVAHVRHFEERVIPQVYLGKVMCWRLIIQPKTKPSSSGADSKGHGGACPPLIQKLGTRGHREYRKTANSLSSQLLFWRGLTLETLRWLAFRRFNWTPRYSAACTGFVRRIAYILQAFRHGIPVRPWTWTGLPGRRPSAGHQDSRSRSSSTSALDVPSTRLSATERFPFAADEHGTVCQPKWRHHIPCKPSKPNKNRIYSWLRFNSFQIVKVSVKCLKCYGIFTLNLM